MATLLCFIAKEFFTKWHFACLRCQTNGVICEYFDSALDEMLVFESRINTGVLHGLNVRFAFCLYFAGLSLCSTVIVINGSKFLRSSI